MIWGYEIAPTAARHLAKLGPSAASKIKAFLNKRFTGTTDPRAFGKPLRGDLHGLWRYRVEDYRIICRIEDTRVVVTVVAVGHRSEVYD